MNNVEWSKNLLRALHNSGVRYLCLAPGSRSSPLALAAAESSLEVLIHFDERGVGFLALGLAKVQREPVALLVTSGSAVGNLLPALMEASYDDLPLIVLSADRPPELHNCGANQTSDQVKIFANFTRLYIDLPCADASLSSYLSSTVSYAVETAKRRKGPVQINCMLREPLVTPLNSEIADPFYGVCRFEEGVSELLPEKIEELAAMLSAIEQGLILCGEEAPVESLLLAERLQWPLFADVTSSLRGKSRCEVRYYEHLLKNFSIKMPQAIVQFGRRITSKTVLEWCKKIQSPLYLQINENWERFDPHFVVRTRITAAPAMFARKIASHLPFREGTKWLTSSLALSAQVEERIEETLGSTYSEPGFAHLLAHTGRINLFFANSMPIRDAEAFYFPKEPSGKVFARRGLSGIDGNIATVLGISYVLEAPLVAVLGDLAFLHDLNSLAIAEELMLPTLFLIINNQGAGVFSFLPNLPDSPHFEKFLACAHSYQFKAAAELFGISYHAARTAPEVISCLQQFEREPKMTIVELFTNREENRDLHREIEQIIQDIEVKINA